MRKLWFVKSQPSFFCLAEISDILNFSAVCRHTVKVIGNLKQTGDFCGESLINMLISYFSFVSSLWVNIWWCKTSSELYIQCCTKPSIFDQTFHTRQGKVEKKKNKLVTKLCRMYITCTYSSQHLSRVIGHETKFWLFQFYIICYWPELCQLSHENTCPPK